MVADGGGSHHDLKVQSWSMFGVGIALYMIRIFARFRKLGFKLQSDDYLMVFAIGWYTGLVVTNLDMSRAGSSLLFYDQLANLTPEEKRQRSAGAKVEFASEQCMLNVMYTLKACMLIIYFRITTNLRQGLFVKICAAYTFCGWLASQLVLFFNCRPFSGYFAIPPPQEECATYFRFLVIQAVFNISSDVAVMSVVLPMLYRMQMKWREKVPLVFIFSLGLLLIVCAIVSKIFTFRDVYDHSYQFWYLREASIGVYISNLPYVWGLLRHTLIILQSTVVRTDENHLSDGHRRTPTVPRKRDVVSGKDRVPSSLVELEAMRGSRGRRSLPNSESEERMVRPSDSGPCSTGDQSDTDVENGKDPYGIWRTTEIIVQNDGRPKNTEEYPRLDE